MTNAKKQNIENGNNSQNKTNNMFNMNNSHTMNNNLNQNLFTVNNSNSMENLQNNFFDNFNNFNNIQNISKNNTEVSSPNNSTNPMQGTEQDLNNEALDSSVSSNDKKNRRPFIERVGDWTCFKCRNLNFSFRILCNRCQTPKQESDRLHEQFMINYSNYLRFNEMMQNRILMNHPMNFMQNQGFINNNNINISNNFFNNEATFSKGGLSADNFDNPMNFNNMGFAGYNNNYQFFSQQQMFGGNNLDEKNLGNLTPQEKQMLLSSNSNCNTVKKINGQQNYPGMDNVMKSKNGEIPHNNLEGIENDFEEEIQNK